MKINQVQFNLIYPKPQSTVNSPLRMKSPILEDTVSFSGNTEPVKKPNPLDKLVPKNKGIIYKKVRDEKGKVIEKVPVKTDIVNDGGGLFLFKIDGKEVGGVLMTCLFDDEKTEKSELTNDYKNEGIVGDRMYVNYVQNDNQEEYDVPEFKDDAFLPLMYMPEEMVKELEKELKKNPIFEKKRIKK